MYKQDTKQLYLGNHSETDTCSHDFFFLTMVGTVTSKNIDSFSWITLNIVSVRWETNKMSNGALGE